MPEDELRPRAGRWRNARPDPWWAFRAPHRSGGSSGALARKGYGAGVTAQVVREVLDSPSTSEDRCWTAPCDRVGWD